MIIVDALTNNVNRTAADMRCRLQQTAVTWVHRFCNTYLTTQQSSCRKQRCWRIIRTINGSRRWRSWRCSRRRPSVVALNQTTSHTVRKALEDLGITEFTVSEIEMIPQWSNAQKATTYVWRRMINALEQRTFKGLTTWNLRRLKVEKAKYLTYKLHFAFIS